MCMLKIFRVQTYFVYTINYELKLEKEMKCSQVCCPTFGICSLHFTHSNTHTHTEQWAAISAAVLGE